MSLQEMLPFFIPLAIVELVLLFYTLWHIFTHTHYKRGTRLMWCIIAIVGMQFIGPVLYLYSGGRTNKHGYFINPRAHKIFRFPHSN